MFQKHPEAGFTLVEIMVTIGMMAALAGLTMINLGKPQTTATLNGTVTTLVGDLKTQQLLAMSGDDGGSAAAQPHGVIIEPSGYTLFNGTTFDSGDANNYSVTPGEGIALSTTFTDSTISFDRISGEVHGFVDGGNTITVQKDDESKTITINRLGTITVN